MDTDQERADKAAGRDSAPRSPTAERGSELADDDSTRHRAHDSGVLNTLWRDCGFTFACGSFTSTIDSVFTPTALSQYDDSSTFDGSSWRCLLDQAGSLAGLCAAQLHSEGGKEAIASNNLECHGQRPLSPPGSPPSTTLVPSDASSEGSVEVDDDEASDAGGNPNPPPYAVTIQQSGQRSQGEVAQTLKYRAAIAYLREPSTIDLIQNYSYAASGIFTPSYHLLFEASFICDHFEHLYHSGFAPASGIAPTLLASLRADVPELHDHLMTFVRFGNARLRSDGYPNAQSMVVQINLAHPTPTHMAPIHRGLHYDAIGDPILVLTVLGTRQIHLEDLGPEYPQSPLTYITQRPLDFYSLTDAGLSEGRHAVTYSTGELHLSLVIRYSIHGRGSTAPGSVISPPPSPPGGPLDPEVTASLNIGREPPFGDHSTAVALSEALNRPDLKTPPPPDELLQPERRDVHGDRRPRAHCPVAQGLSARQTQIERRRVGDIQPNEYLALNDRGSTDLRALGSSAVGPFRQPTPRRQAAAATLDLQAQRLHAAETVKEHDELQRALRLSERDLEERERPLQASLDELQRALDVSAHEYEELELRSQREGEELHIHAPAFP